uniref:PDZ domain-containing protein n=1 Tax=uncultured Thiotrichaceae bacterium TaxID=298394 RepID=A0A6S6UJV6_9GAMM|nr:MAG: Unknown protein [uncultured Thiotrichaceae bacterium]
MKINHSRYAKSLYTPLLTIALLTATVTAGHAAELQHKTQQQVLQHLDQQQSELKVVSPEQKLSFAELMEQLKDKRVVFVGEKHDRYDHHLNQLAILRAMHQQNPNIAVGVEWFQQSFQSVVDQYLAGKISETELLLQTEYYQRWRYDYRMLRPIMEFAKEHQLSVIALNAQAEIASAVSQEGLTGLSEKQRKQIPDTIHPPPEKYKTYLDEVFKEHMGGHGDAEHFIQVQRIWDETMAMNTVKYLTAHPEHHMVVFAGSGHLGRGAIPNDVARTIPADQLSTVHSVKAEAIEPDSFDYFILSNEQTLSPTGKLGAWLDDKTGKVSILKLAEDGAAGEAGLKKGDLLLEMNGQPIDSIADLLIMLTKHQPGDEVELLTERDGKPLKHVFPLK